MVISLSCFMVIPFIPTSGNVIVYESQKHLLLRTPAEFYVLFTVHPCTISQIYPTRCTILFNIFIYFSSLRVSGFHAPIIRRNYCIYATLVFVTLYWWCLVSWLNWVSIKPADHVTHTVWQVPMSPIYSKFSWWWAHGPPKHAEKRNK